MKNRWETRAIPQKHPACYILYDAAINPHGRPDE